LKRTLGVAKKTAWYLNHRIRKAMSDVNADAIDRHRWRVDETYLGSRRRTHGIGAGNYRPFKQIILGAVERQGRLRMSVGYRQLQNQSQGVHRQGTLPTNARASTPMACPPTRA
jgi:hypothetical protein